MFYNYTNEDFHATWGGQPYTFKAGQVYKGLAIADDGIKNVELTEAVCSVWAHHLAHNVLNAPSLNANYRLNKEGIEVSNELEARKVHNIGNVDILKQLAMSGPDTEIAIPKSLEVLPLMSDAPEEERVAEEAEVVAKPVEEPVVAPKKKAGRPRKEEASPSPEAEFNV